jgi:hypothetical protein
MNCHRHANDMEVQYEIFLPYSTHSGLPSNKDAVSFTIDASSHLLSLSKQISNCRDQLNQTFTAYIQAFGKEEREKESKLGLRGDHGKGVRRDAQGEQPEEEEEEEDG